VLASVADAVTTDVVVVDAVVVAVAFSAMDLLQLLEKLGMANGRTMMQERLHDRGWRKEFIFGPCWFFPEDQRMDRNLEMLLEG
jgi:hypothetical protein